MAEGNFLKKEIEIVVDCSSVCYVWVTSQIFSVILCHWRYNILIKLLLCRWMPFIHNLSCPQFFTDNWESGELEIIISHTCQVDLKPFFLLQANVEIWSHYSSWLTCQVWESEASISFACQVRNRHLHNFALLYPFCYLYANNVCLNQVGEHSIYFNISLLPCQVGDSEVIISLVC